MQENSASERGLRAERRQIHPATAESACADFPSSASRLFLSGMRGSFGPAVLIEAPHKKVGDLCGPPTFLNMLNPRIIGIKLMLFYPNASRRVLFCALKGAQQTKNGRGEGSTPQKREEKKRFPARPGHFCQGMGHKRRKGARGKNPDRTFLTGPGACPCRSPDVSPSPLGSPRRRIALSTASLSSPRRSLRRAFFRRAVARPHSRRLDAALPAGEEQLPGRLARQHDFAKS